jgi:hypothetical protein
MLRALDSLLIDWGEATRRLQRGELGHLQRSPLARAAQGHTDTPGRRGSVPSFTLPERLLPVDRALRELPAALRPAVDVRYLHDLDRQGQEAAWCERTRKGRRGYYAALEGAHWWLAGRLSAGAGRG